MRRESPLNRFAGYHSVREKVCCLEVDVETSRLGFPLISPRAWDISSVGSSDGLLNRVSEVQALDVPPGLQFVGFYQPRRSRIKDYETYTYRRIA